MQPYISTWWFQAIGWLGSGLVVLSLTQSNVLRFRWLNALGALIAAAWNAVTGMWPFVAMNGAILLIDLYHLHRWYSQRNSPAEGNTRGGIH